MPRLEKDKRENMIRFKLCKMYNSVEVEFEDPTEIDFEMLNEIYDRMPDCKTSEATLAPVSYILAFLTLSTGNSLSI